MIHAAVGDQVDVHDAAVTAMDKEVSFAVVSMTNCKWEPLKASGQPPLPKTNSPERKPENCDKNAEV